MIKILILSISIVLLLYKSSLSQSHSIEWEKLFKEHDVVHIIINEYVDKFQPSLYSSISIDSIAVFAPKEFDNLPTPIAGMEKFCNLIKYPEIARRASIERNIVVSATIDTFGNANNAEIVFGNYELFHSSILTALKETKFIPAKGNNKLTEVQVAIAISFFQMRNENIQIDSIIVEKSISFEASPTCTITLSKNGEVIYDGFNNVDKLGKWKSVLSGNNYEGVTSLVYAINFFNMNEIYRTYASDLPWITITVKAGTLTKIIKTDYYLPILELGKLIDYLSEDLDWEEIKE